MPLLHGDPAASFAHKLHGGQLLFPDVGVIHIRSTAKTALSLISTRVTKVTRIICYCTTILTSICHDNHGDPSAHVGRGTQVHGQISEDIMKGLCGIKQAGVTHGEADYFS